MSIVPKIAGSVVDPAQQIEQMSQMISQMIVSQSQDARAALDAVNAAAQKEIDALKMQVTAMEKTVAASQRALAESRTRALQNPRIYAAKRQAEKAEVDALKKQIAESDQLEASLYALLVARKVEYEAIYPVVHMFNRPSYWTEGTYPAAMDFIRTYIGEDVYHKEIYRRQQLKPCVLYM